MLLQSHVQELRFNMEKIVTLYHNDFWMSPYIVAMALKESHVCTTFTSSILSSLLPS